jgi:hypothetical protein
MVDNLGAGMIGPFLSYWFFFRYGVELTSLGFVFSLSYLLGGLLQFFHDCMFYALFRNVRPPEEAQF